MKEKGYVFPLLVFWWSLLLVLSEWCLLIMWNKTNGHRINLQIPIYGYYFFTRLCLQFPITAIREIKILKKLHHENVIKLKEIVTSTGNLMIFIFFC